ncbi:dehydrogenase [Orrella marina]|uniref:Dehydrogenase n=1 Tax=Orrella marina TaxID=2163011 RepID=A0A2R4XPR1_9BURK|nr:dehydrogenase [Orrella marina]
MWYVSPGQAEIRTEDLENPEDPGEQTCLVRAVYSAISRGTESLIFHGRVPASEYERMQAPFMGGKFPFPVRYGYCHVGQVIQGPSYLLGQYVFSLSPHQTLLRHQSSALVPVPPSVSPKRAVLAANMETALNAVWTGKPCASDRIAVVGAGLIGLLVAYLCRDLPGAQVTVIDPQPSRASVCKQLGLNYCETTEGTDNCDVVFHASATAAGLSSALALAGNEASVVELSWYGDQTVPVALGQAFHSQQIRLISCQVGHIESSHAPRWNYRRRLTAAMSMLSDPCLDALLETPIPFESLPEEISSIFKPGSDRLCQVIQYPDGVN